MEEAFAVNDRINQLLLEHIDPQAWRAQLPGCKGRTIAAIFAHVHNIRLKWLRLSAPHLKPPPRLDRARCTKQQAMKALAQSAALCSQMLAEAFASIEEKKIDEKKIGQKKTGEKKTRVQKFHRDGWAQPWPVGAAMFAYMITHEAHHRGQVCMLAHQFGFKLPNQTTSRIWGWERLWKESGFGPPQ
jgi:uncharacterized damage-inducible protein DinB